MVLVDLEHFFDGYKASPEFSLRAIEAAVVNGASHLVLCDTNGGTLPDEVGRIVADVKAHVGDDAIIGIHCHDDTGCAVANSMAAVAAGAGHVQGTLNGLGERTGNTNLTTVIPNLQLKLGYTCLPDGRIERLTAVSHHVAETLNRAVNPQAPYVGSSAFAHKAGLHVSAIVRAKDAYEHVNPELVGNGTRFVVSEMAGRATIQMKADEIGIEMDGAVINEVDRRAQAPRARGLPLRGGRCVARTADAPRRRHRARVLPCRVDAGDHRRAAGRRVHDRGHRQGVGRRR